MKTEHKAYINGFSAVSCAGNNSQEIFKNICDKQELISLDTTYVPKRTVAIGKIQSEESFNTLLLQNIKEVLSQSNLDDFSNTLLVIGSSVGGMRTTEEHFFNDGDYKNINYKRHAIDAIAHEIQEHFTFQDDISFSTACTSSANALGYAKEVIAKGIYSNVLVIGIDALCHTTVCGFSALSVLSSHPCTPFEVNREGMNVAEGIAVLLLQNEAAKNSVQLCGVGYSSDAHHMTQPHPDGLGAVQAMKNALEDASVEPHEVEYINAHGTGTKANDSSEMAAIASLFPHQPIVSSTKSYTGHTLGAAGALEALICTMAIQKGIIPPSKDIKNPEREDISFVNKPLHEELNYVVSNSFAFGGNNTSLVLGKIHD